MLKFMQLSVTGQGFISQIGLTLLCFLLKCNSHPVFMLVSGVQHTDSIILIQVQFLQTVVQDLCSPGSPG